MYMLTFLPTPLTFLLNPQERGRVMRPSAQRPGSPSTCQIPTCCGGKSADFLKHQCLPQHIHQAGWGSLGTLGGWAINQSFNLANLAQCFGSYSTHSPSYQPGRVSQAAREWLGTQKLSQDYQVSPFSVLSGSDSLKNHMGKPLLLPP